ncbi:MAG: FAD:protein FMN transferase [Planctomycetota bacterium]|nr:FAD:protein FMN transferase [Planctomycetota bacterium]MDP6939064.1 FAD:protein FMN transferase [Planctomycetota bacterium]
MSVVSPEGQDQDHWIERRCSAMGTGFRIEIAAPTRAQALRASEMALRAVESCERRLSTWDGNPDGELARLNRAPVGQVVTLSAPLAQELNQALAWNRKTSGCFNPAVGSLVAAWDLRGEGRLPTGPELQAALAHSSPAGFKLQGTLATRTSPGLLLEEGGFGKGAGLDAALAALQETPMTAMRLDLGGQWLIASTSTSHAPARFAVAHPAHRGQSVLHLTMTSGSVATSGNSERGIEVQGQRLGHLLDPTTGRPTRDFGSLTVLAPTALAADALSTGLYVMGPEKAVEWCSSQEGIDAIALLVTPNGLVALASPGLKGRLKSCIQSLQITFPVSTAPTQ